MADLPKGKSIERNADGRPINLPGIYIHKETKMEYITAEGDEGVVQADALMSPVWQGGWERVGDVPSRTELLERQELQLLKDQKAEAKAKVEKEARFKAALEDEPKVEAEKPKAGGETYTPELAKK